MSGPQLFADVDDMVAATVRPQTHVHLAATMARPNALLYALARTRQGRADTVVSCAAVHSSAHALALSGAVRRVITGFLGDTYPTPGPNPLYANLMAGEPFTAEIWPLWALQQRLMAAGTGAPAAVTRSLQASDLRHTVARQITAVPLSDGTRGHLLRPLRPDVTFVHAVLADRSGNLVLASPTGEGPWSAYAAREGVVATAERIVDELPAAAYGLPMIPGHLVQALCTAERGAHPQALATHGLPGVQGYDDDYRFLEEVTTRCRAGDGPGWFNDWVVAPGSHAAYLRALDARPTPPSCGAAGGPSPRESGPSERATLIVLGARAVADRVLDGGYRTVLAGIGVSHMAAWLARELLARRGTDLKVCAELGFYDMRPDNGDPYLFARGHANRPGTSAGIAEILGGVVGAGADRCLGVLSAAQLDPTGSLNTSLLPDGRWLTGPGGACDIASSVECVLVAPARPNRYVPAVHHITSPGHRVHTCVSQYGRFARDTSKDPLQLTTWLSPLNTDHASPGSTIAATTNGWPTPDRPPRQEEPVSDEELRLLHALDPHGVYH
ncbi:CoA-transferase [Streptomyces cyaneofuscatus]|uniref:CoA-transferase n=1 Tax=Streptomyces cyaneofuscatus TaxID=66883 RepID=UPI00365E49A4